MLDCPRSYALFIFLMGCSYALVGLLTWWAATSHRHWFLRTAVVVGCAALFLWRPMYEPFFGVLWTQLFVWLGLAAAREWRRWRAARKLGRGWRWRASWRPRFTVAELGLVVVPVAVCCAAFARTSEETRWGCLYGAIEALVVTIFVLLGVWCGTMANRKTVKIAVVLIALVLFGLITYWSEFGPIWFIQKWASRGPRSRSVVLGYNAAYWFLTFSLVVVFVGLVVKLAASAIRDAGKQQTNATIIGVIVAIVSLGPGYVGWLVSHPLPIPPEPPLKKLDLATVNELVKKADVIQRQAYPEKQLAAFYQQVRDVIPDESYLPPHLTSRPAPVSSGDFGLIALVVKTQAVYYFDVKKVPQAIDALEQTFRLARMLDYGAIEVYLNREMIEDLAIDCLEFRRQGLDLQSTEKAEAMILGALRNRTPLESFMPREQVREQRAGGWQWHAAGIVERIAGEYEPWYQSAMNEQLSDTEKRSIARLRLMVIELAIHRHQLLTGSFPQHLESLSDLPADALEDPYRTLPVANFRYQHRGSSYKLYSVGPDQRDDGGKPMQTFNRVPRGDGDLLLDGL